MSARGLSRRLLLGLAATALALLSAELALRLLERSRSNEPDLEAALEASRRAELGDADREHSLKGLIQPSRWQDVVYELKPGLKGRFKGQPIEINGHGFRGAEVTPAKPPDTFRIAGLGDSVMFGWGVGQGEDYLSRLERKLARAAADRIEVLNFAVPGYNTAMEAAAFDHKVLPFDVDLVILHLMANDARLPQFMVKSPRFFSLRYSALWNLVRGAGGIGAGEPELLPRSGWSSGYQRVDQRFGHLVGESGAYAAFDRLARSTAERRIPVVILLNGDGHRPEGVAREVAGKHGFHVIDPRPAMLDHLRKRGLSVTDFGAALWVSPTDPHPNARAHRILGNVLARRLRQAGLIPTAGSQPRETSPRAP